MFGLKSTVLNATLAATFVIPVATAGLFASAGSAQAYTGSFNYIPSALDLDAEPTEAYISQDFIKFDPNPGAISLQNRKGDFLNDKRGYIKSFAINPFTSFSEFIDVGASDGTKLLSLTSISPLKFEAANGGTEITLNFNGIFEDKSKVKGFITFDTQDTNAENTYKTGGSIQASFTGLAVTTVPEPATMLGLGLVGVGMAMSRRRKAAAN